MEPEETSAVLKGGVDIGRNLAGRSEGRPRRLLHAWTGQGAPVQSHHPPMNADVAWLATAKLPVGGARSKPRLYLPKESGVVGGRQLHAGRL
jgi:hypothetical protein